MWPISTIFKPPLAGLGSCIKLRNEKESWIPIFFLGWFFFLLQLKGEKKSEEKIRLADDGELGYFHWIGGASAGFQVGLLLTLQIVSGKEVWFDALSTILSRFSMKLNEISGFRTPFLSGIVFLIPFWPLHTCSAPFSSPGTERRPFSSPTAECSWPSSPLVHAWHSCSS